METCVMAVDKLDRSSVGRTQLYGVLYGGVLYGGHTKQM